MPFLIRLLFLHATFKTKVYIIFLIQNPGQALCHRCVSIPVRESATPVGGTPSSGVGGGGGQDPGACAGCRQQLREGQALVALDRQWHVWCFKCHSCDTVLHGEYMGKYVSYDSAFSVRCADLSIKLQILADKKFLTTLPKIR